VKILFDQNVPRPLAALLSGHEVWRAAELGWHALSNGELITSAEAHISQIVITADKNLRYQQNLKGRNLAIVILPSGRWPKLRPRVSEVVKAVDTARGLLFGDRAFNDSIGLVSRPSSLSRFKCRHRLACFCVLYPGAQMARLQRFQSCCTPEPRNQVAFSSRKRHLSPN
jgi:hypothetical protein